MPRRQQSAPASPPSGSRVSAALRSREPGVILGAAWVLAPRAAWGNCCLMAVLVREAKPLRVDSTFSAERFAGFAEAPAWCGYPGAAKVHN